MLEKVITGSCLGHKAGCLSSPFLLLKDWSIPRETLVFRPSWKTKKGQCWHDQRQQQEGWRCGKSETSISKQSCLFFGPHSIWTATGSTAPLKEILLLSVNPSCRSFSEMSRGVPFNSRRLQTKKAYHLRSKKEGEKDPFCKYQCPNSNFSKNG